MQKIIMNYFQRHNFFKNKTEINVCVFFLKLAICGLHVGLPGS